MCENDLEQKCVTNGSTENVCGTAKIGCQKGTAWWNEEVN